jgi:hypothetical protein
MGIFPINPLQGQGHRAPQGSASDIQQAGNTRIFSLQTVLEKYARKCFNSARIQSAGELRPDGPFPEHSALEIVAEKKLAQRVPA